MGEQRGEGSWVPTELLWDPTFSLLSAMEEAGRVPSTRINRMLKLPKKLMRRQLRVSTLLEAGWTGRGRAEGTRNGGFSRGHQGTTRTDVPPVKASLTLWRKGWSGKSWRQGGQHSGEGPVWEREDGEMVTSTRGGTGDREGWRC